MRATKQDARQNRVIKFSDGKIGKASLSVIRKWDYPISFLARADVRAFTLGVTRTPDFPR